MLLIKFVIPIYYLLLVMFYFFMHQSFVTPPPPPRVGNLHCSLGILKEMQHFHPTRLFLTENLHHVALTKSPPGSTHVNPCKWTHPRKIWGCKFDVQSPGYGASSMCKLPIMSPLLPHKFPIVYGGLGKWWACGGNKWLAL